MISNKLIKTANQFFLCLTPPARDLCQLLDQPLALSPAFKQKKSYFCLFCVLFSFLWLLQLLDLFIQWDWSTYLADYGQPTCKYLRVNPTTALILLEKWVWVWIPGIIFSLILLWANRCFSSSFHHVWCWDGGAWGAGSSLWSKEQRFHPWVDTGSSNRIILVYPTHLNSRFGDKMSWLGWGSIVLLHS